MTRTARGREIDMASLAAANEKAIAVGNIPMNARGDILTSHGGEIPTQEIQQEFYEKKFNEPKSNVKTIDDLQAVPSISPKKNVITPDLTLKVVAERPFSRGNKKFIEIEYADGSIEEKEVE